MSPEIRVLRALLRLARRRSPATTAELLARIEGDEGALRRALVRLERADLVLRTPEGARLSLAGLAVAAATIPPVAEPRARRSAAARPARPRVLPLVRRRRAA